jgi:MFS family permease
VLRSSSARSHGAVEFAPVVLFSPLAGVAADRFDRRRLMIASDVVGATAVGALAVAVLTHNARFWLILLVAFVDMTAATVYRAGSSGAFRSVVPQAQFANAASVTYARASSVRLAAHLQGARSSASCAGCRSSPTRSPTASRR